MRARIIFIILKKKYENETKTNNTIVSPLILHIIADGIKNNVEYFIVCTASYTLCKQKTHIYNTYYTYFRKKTATLDLLVKILVFWRRYIQTPPSTLPNPSLLPRLGLILWAHNSAAIFKIRKKSAKKNILKITFNPKNSLNKDEYSFKSNEIFFFSIIVDFSL